VEYRNLRSQPSGRRASLSEIGFGKLETYKKIFDLGEGTYATVYLGKSLLTGKSVALKEVCCLGIIVLIASVV